ncbi:MULTISPECIES: pheST operon leader peptide PheM [Pantoea]|nr:MULTISPECIES: pheST operon leader peptide PheM [Pantoea]MBS6034665.1 pheST operon leader peptide PheM [Pantoea sp.]MBZ6395914.1 pheST operon leader peptide PheM [Pantoea sp.]MBZ6437614.1 pheST operon leader peptide PheM [Pantoea sp.]MCQ5470192.1 pheST operon leader peptide PheM [Pantoea brenneri]MDH1086754.1 pheST operon leader peptide PheM [Pantoea brenneri]
MTAAIFRFFFYFSA